MTENQKKPPPLHIPSYRWLPPKGECSDGKVEGNVVKIFSFTHTPLSRTSVRRGNVATGSRC